MGASIKDVHEPPQELYLVWRALDATSLHGIISVGYTTAVE
jgi:hypothetical protein